MTSQEFIDFAKSKVQEWLLCRLKYDPNCLLAADADYIDDIFSVWYAKDQRKYMALLGTRFANYYFECTYDRSKKVMYMDVLGTTWQDMKMFKAHH